MTDEQTAGQAAEQTAPAGPDSQHAGAQKVFFLCFTDPVEGAQDALREHLAKHKAWVVDREGTGQVFLAGPLLDENYRAFGSGLIVVRAGSLDEAKRIVDTDPFHQRGIRTYRLVPWQINEGSFDVKFVLSSGRLDWN